VVSEWVTSTPSVIEMNLASPDTFFSCDLRVGTVRSCASNPKARKPAYVMSIDFGSEIGTRVSSAQITDLYSADEIVGRQVIAVVNFPPKSVAGVESQCLVLGFETEVGVVLLCADRPVPDGIRVS
jgi:tRNA-binding protein